MWYKVVHKNYIDSRYFSAMKHYVPAVEYKLGEFVYPRIGCLYVFKELKDARRFKDNASNSYLCIYECEVIRPRKVKSLVSLGFNTITKINEFWKQKSQKKKINVEIMKAPIGSYAVDAIK